MKATLLDLRRNPGKIVEAIERNESVTLSKRGREIACIIPNTAERGPIAMQESPAFGLWKDHADFSDPSTQVRQLRRGRFHAL